MPIIFFLLVIPLLIALIDFLAFVFKRQQVVNIVILRIAEIGAFLILPYLYVSMETKNNCCSDSAVFSPEHQLSMWVIIALCLISYFYSSYRKKVASPVIEVVINCFLLICIVLNIFIAFHTEAFAFAIIGNLPIILFTLLVLAKNQNLFIKESQPFNSGNSNNIQGIAWKVLSLKPLSKFPILFILCLPIIVLLTAILLLFGQKPDSIIRAFTDTYKHGFSQWDYKCENVECGGHYLCSVAANGHHKIVKPQRLGVRNGHTIICNRQLLVSNAFEDLIQTKLPITHKIIRYQYNKVGNIVHRYYTVFNNKIISDIIYILMKPLEWFFLIALYVADKNPENRIAKQYVSNEHRKQIDATVL